MKVYTLMDNIACSSDFASEFGLSCYIDTGRHRILFDAGSDHLFAENAEKLGVDLSSVDIAVLSHGHFDHGGGMMHFLSLNSHAKIYVAQSAFEEHFNAKDEYIGLSPELAQSDRLVYVDGVLEIDEEVTLIRPEVADSDCGTIRICESAYFENECTMSVAFDCHSGRWSAPKCPKYPIDSFGLKVYRDGNVMPDDFRHELYLKLRVSVCEPYPNGEADSDIEPGASGTAIGSCEPASVLFSGCSHRGILNIMSWFAPDVLFGGFHLFRVNTYGEGAEKLRAIAEELLRYPTMYYTCHCTGIPQYEFLSSLMGEKIRYLAAGDTVHL